MRPLYQHRQIAWPTVIGVGVVVVFFCAVIFLGDAYRVLHPAVTAIMLGIPLVVLLLFGSLTVRVFSDRIKLHFGIGAPWFTIDLRDALGYRVVRSPWYYGWGIRMIPGGVLLNASGFDAVELRMDGGRLIRIGTDEPRALAAVLADLVPRQDPDPAPDEATAAGTRTQWIALAVPALIFLSALIVAATVTCGRVYA